MGIKSIKLTQTHMNKNKPQMTSSSSPATWSEAKTSHLANWNLLKTSLEKIMVSKTSGVRLEERMEKSKQSKD